MDGFEQPEVQQMKLVRPAITLDNLPMFATDLQIAEAVVGREKAEKWTRERLPTLANKPGFPAIDEFHEGRPVALVRRFYENYLGTGSTTATAPPGKADATQWKSKTRQRPQA
ncbi:hypothetical protein [Mesorhizobium sp. L2C067A000]|uniref:hypothetical protein n=1 Tax=Mesorhizobium sp. L2C067A000 TaxID=1287106 RepID=UPI0003D06649|nr:hypothetical protein [Mesorhizobium sp. L2C067A000]ESZ37372.1 hypothetical protein X733_03290 [Mesorhizobium sp. L2C067A000]